MIQMYNDPHGSAYRRLIDYAIEHTAQFMIVIREDMLTHKSCDEVFSQLAPFLVRTERCHKLMEQLSVAYSYEGTIYFYDCTEESAKVLKSVANRLGDWQHPHLPEDLSFLDSEGQEWLINIAHEQIRKINVSEEQAEMISSEIEGVFLKGNFNADFERFIDDAYRHKVEELHISRHEIDQLPDKLFHMTSLKKLKLFEHNINHLPLGLFNLQQLEELIIWTEDLEEIPAKISNLKNLKYLQVYCGSYFELQSGQTVIKKEDVSLCELPPEIGLLSNLEHLSINYTRLHSLPDEFTQLKKLRTLDLRNNMFDSTPKVIEKMLNLKSVNFK
ncbi:leucine-rich repeat domain-containing protein [Bacillus solimangrovi]|uniref:Leucine-rich repeat domain-containing protein n=1 Tax=Bacillus solimangrovi TaxID=1305675 RepID=A0A1E5LHS8_9BACI|nr:leucine-rich repeat domain-containing protein [Bacillus solimangrovi]OEH93642.1 hypothetical protein BFG57_01250 [Bacillus solimangrovi]